MNSGFNWYSIDNYDTRREILLRAIAVVCEDEKLTYKVEEIDDDEIILVGNCEKESKDCVGKYSIKNLITKYHFISDIVEFGKLMLDLFNSSVASYRVEKEEPDFMKTVLTTLEPSKNYYIELVPRNTYWHESGADRTNITTNIDGVKCVWAVSSDRRSYYMNELSFKEYPGASLELFKKRRIADLTRHKQQVRTFEAPSVVEWTNERRTGLSNIIERAFVPEREAKAPHVVKYFEGPRIFELMTYPESCKAVMDYFKYKINEFTVFGLTNDVVYIEETIKDNELVTDDWDREILLKRLMNRNEKRFPVTPDHKGTKMRLQGIEPLKINFILFESDLMMEDPLMNRFYKNAFG